MRRALLLTILSALAAIPLPASAAFHVCNKTDAAARVALGRFDGRHWTSQGWWTLQPGRCARLLDGPLRARYYYLYAADSTAGTWEGRTHFCIAPGAKFVIPGRNDCAQRGFDRRGFFEVDTGNAPDWTQTLAN
ncbi:MAG: DUF1036 domain-containing protein [Rhizomicrobium sp.]